MSDVPPSVEPPLGASLAHPTVDPRHLERLLLLAFFVSGATGLVFEVIWTRQLVLIFGATSLAVSSVLAAYMAGLGLGGLVGGKLAERVSRPLVVYGLLEGAVALYGLSVPVILRGLQPVYRLLHHAYAPNFLTFSILRFLVVFAALLIPTTLMGATLPVLSRFATLRGRRSDVGVSRLYAANTFGAVAGTLLAGFVLLENLGLFRANLCAVATGLLLGAGVIALARRFAPAATSLSVKPTEAADIGDDPDEESSLGRWVALGFGISGAASMIDEVVWTRALVLVMGPSTYAFSVMLAAFLAGIALGSAVGANRAARLSRPALWFALVQVLAAGATLLAMGGYEPMAWLYRMLSGAGPGGRGPLSLGVKTLAACALLIPSAFCFGASFPLAAAAFARGRRLSLRVGQLYGANTLGCIVGSLGAGFLLVPRLGLEPALTVAASLNLGVGVLLFLAQDALSPGLRLGALLSFGILGAAMFTHGPRWDLTYLAAGVRSGPKANAEVVFNEPGYNATISVTRSHQPHVPVLSLRTDGKTDASDIADAETQLQLGLAPLALHPNPTDVLVVGFASGTTCGAVLKDPRVQRLDVLEIERAMIHASKLFEHVNGRPLEDPRTHLIETDARNHYRVSEQKYDVIISEPSNPWLAGPSHLFTREAFQEAHDLLKPGGLMLQWMQAYSIQPDTGASILAAFHSAFRHVRVFAIPQANDFMILGSDAAVPLDLPAIDARLAQPAVAERLAQTSLRTAFDLVSEAVGDDRSIEELIRGQEMNTDDNGFVEFHAPRDRERAPALLKWLARPYAGPYDELAAAGMDPDQIGARAGLRVLLDGHPEIVPALLAWLQKRGATATAERFEDALHLHPPRSAPTTPWQALLAQAGRWFANAPEPVPVALRLPGTGREAQLLAALEAGADPTAISDPLFRFIRLRRLAELGQCGPLQTSTQDLMALRDPVVNATSLAVSAANAHELARAFTVCGDPQQASVFASIEHDVRSSIADQFVLDEPSHPELALEQDPENIGALELRIRSRCQAADARGEIEDLTRLVALDPWRSLPAARLAFLTRDRPATDFARATALHAMPYLLPGQPRELDHCLDAAP